MLLRQELSPTSVGCVGNEVAEQLQERGPCDFVWSINFLGKLTLLIGLVVLRHQSYEMLPKNLQQTNYIVVYVQLIFSTPSTSSPTS